MKLGLACVGRMKAGPERDILERYVGRIAALRRMGLDGLDIREIDESREKTPDGRREREGAELRALFPNDAVLVAFDERGRAVDSEAFARFVGETRDAGRKSLWFVIGGPDGLDAQMRTRATAVFSFGAMTLPHQLVRIVAVEQIYRAMTILLGHPYHRP
jgi:23S rRNA (pseudouridine1915-N3)-methyltransferase